MRKNLIITLLCTLPWGILFASQIYHDIQRQRFDRAEEAFYNTNIVLTECLREAIDSYVQCDSNRAIVSRCIELMHEGAFDQIT